jgi:hypothetical protein
MHNDTRDELISAALDAEPVDVHALRAALATPEGREVLASFLLLRAVVVGDAIAPQADPTAVAAAAGVRPPRWARPFAWQVQAGVAASLTIVLTLGAFWLGTAWQQRSMLLPSSQPPARASAPASALSEGARLTGSRSQAAENGVPPAPSRVLRFTPGVDWHEGL